jgi:hypothetical protein
MAWVGSPCCIATTTATGAPINAKIGVSTKIVRQKQLMVARCGIIIATLSSA